MAEDSSAPDNAVPEESWNEWIVADIQAMSKEREEEEFEKSPAGQAMKRLERKNKSQGARSERPRTAGAASKYRKKPRVPFDNFEGCLRRSNFRAFYDDPSETPEFLRRPKTTGQVQRRQSRAVTSPSAFPSAKNDPDDDDDLDDNASGVVMIDMAATTPSVGAMFDLAPTQSASPSTRPGTAPSAISAAAHRPAEMDASAQPDPLPLTSAPVTADKEPPEVVESDAPPRQATADAGGRKTGVLRLQGLHRTRSAQLLAQSSTAPEMELVPEFVQTVASFRTPTWSRPSERKHLLPAWRGSTQLATTDPNKVQEDIGATVLGNKFGSFRDDPEVAAAIANASNAAAAAAAAAETTAATAATAANDTTGAGDDISVPDVSRAHYTMQQRLVHIDTRFSDQEVERSFLPRRESVDTDNMPDDLLADSQEEPPTVAESGSKTRVSVSLEPTNSTESSTTTELDTFPSLQVQVRNAVATSVMKSPGGRRGRRPSTWEEFTAGLEVGALGKPGARPSISKTVLEEEPDGDAEVRSSPIRSPNFRGGRAHPARSPNFVRRNELSANFFTKGTLMDIRDSNKKIEKERRIGARERRSTQMMQVMEHKAKAVARHDELVAATAMRKHKMELGRRWLAVLSTAGFVDQLRVKSERNRKAMHIRNQFARAANIIRSAWIQKFGRKMLSGLLKIRRAGGLTLVVGLRIWRKGVKANLIRKFMQENKGSRVWVMKHFVAQIRKAQRIARDFIATTKTRYDILDMLWMHTERRVRRDAVAPIMADAQVRHKAKMKQLEKERLRNSLHWRWHKTETKSKNIFQRLDDVDQKKRETMMTNRRMKQRGKPHQLGGAMEAKKVNSKKMRIEQARDEAMWNAMARDPVPVKVRRQYIQAWMRKERQRHIGAVDNEREKAMKSIIQEDDVLNLLATRGPNLSKRFAEKQLGCLDRPPYPTFSLLSDLNNRVSEHHENFWTHIESMIRDDVTTGMARIMSSGRADAVIARAAANGAL